MLSFSYIKSTIHTIENSWNKWRVTCFKDPFLKTVADTCRILSGWKIVYANRDTRLPEANNGMPWHLLQTC